MLFDSHCHLTDAAFDGDRDAVLERAARAGVTRTVTVASDAVDAARAVELARGREGLWCTAGVHPHEAGSATPEALERVEELAASGSDVVAVGECGLDFHYDNAPRDRQREAFRAQLGLAAALDLPVVVHSRDADADTADLISGFEGRVVGVLHCFTGGRELMETALAAGWYVSFSGIVTFKRFSQAEADLVRAVPGDRLLVETDSPYLAPPPHRGKRNEPAYVARVAEAVPRHGGERMEGLAAATTANALRFYGLAGR